MRKVSFAVILAVVLAATGAAHAKSAIEVTPDTAPTQVVLVNKAVGTEQWVISLDYDFDTVTGNVFDLTGKPPTFFSCDVTFEDDTVDLSEIGPQMLTLDCQVAGGCASLPCDDTWHAIDQITLPGSFFLP